MTTPYSPASTKTRFAPWEADLVGAFLAGGGVAEEILLIPLSRWHVTVFLAPQVGRDPQGPTSEKGFGAGPDDESEESASQDPSRPRAAWSRATRG